MNNINYVFLKGTPICASLTPREDRSPLGELISKIRSMNTGDFVFKRSGQIQQGAVMKSKYPMLYDTIVLLFEEEPELLKAMADEEGIEIYSSQHHFAIEQPRVGNEDPLRIYIPARKVAVGA